MDARERATHERTSEQACKRDGKGQKEGGLEGFCGVLW